MDMGFLKLLLIVGLILATSTAFFTDNLKSSYRLSNNSIPVHYDINLTPHLEEGNFTFYGESNVNIKIRYVSSNISLHSRKLEINETATTLINNDGAIYKPTEHAYNNVTHILTLNFDDVLSPGLYTLNMKFSGNLSESGFLKNGFMKTLYTDKEGNSTWLVVTCFQPNAARQMFPCWDEPALKATFNISIMHHQKYRVLSNMPMREQVTERDGIVRTYFNTTPIMSTYLVAIVMSNFVRVGNANETVNVWCRSSVTSQVKFARSIAETVAQHLVQYTNSSEKVPKMDHVMVQNYPVYGMENWGLVIYNESKVIYDDSTDPTFRRRDVASLVAHELVHQWFGNLVTPAWWSHLWLSEGFAEFLQAYFLDKIFEDWRMMDFLVVRNLHNSLKMDIGLLNTVTLEFDNFFWYKIFSFVVYNKAPVLLRMLYHTITDEVFQKGLIRYFATHQFSSVTSDDLWSAMQSALDESDVPHKDYRIKEVMDTWINQRGYPVVNVKRNYETGEVTISQKCFHTQENNEDVNNKWWIPVTFATETNPDFSNTVPSHWLKPDQNISFQIDPNDWIILNVQQTGYYRVSYDTMNWKKIILYLNSEEYTKIHVLNRAQLVNDAFTFLIDLEYQIDLSVFNIINYLYRETDYVAWYPMFRILEQLRSSNSLPQSEFFKTRMTGLFDRLLQSVGYEENPDDDDITKLKRLDATRWACIVGHSECKRMAAVKLTKHLADPDTHKVPQWWQEWTYCDGLTTANRTTWDKLLELYQRKPDKTLLTFLSCIEDPDIIINYLNITALNTSLFPDAEHSFAFSIIIEKHANNSLVLDYILQNFEIIKPRSVATTVVIKQILWSVFSNEQIDKIKTFSETNINQDPDTLFTIQRLIERRKDDLLDWTIDIF